ncbi:DarT ssDNA thymidine ADP-ribosyltransferase family protein [Protaetiibacter larvae]|uniref:DarT ssDNA thymidine ADP-ribosyltransferase family protein n=1 Tax=Protaetiibacter larvae TaxID=2592654 RepID=UPI00143DD4DA|nr:DarT ssDNA thymidine ADP-ribosyltransferase family protein [Protaetiibacter larvae]
MAGVVSAPPSLKLPGRRVFHVTHVRTLESIALDGALRADAVPDVDVSSATTRELRATATVPDGRAVAEFVAFALAQDSTRWEQLRDGAEGAHWSDAARAARPTEFVLLAVPVDALGADLVFADGDSGASGTRFAAGLDAGTAALRRLHASDPDFRDAELLAAGPVPLDAVAIVTVANDRVRDEVRTLFANAGLPAPRIAVYPPLFQSA